MKKSNKIIHYDNQSDVLYLGVRKGVEEEFAEIAPGIMAELDKKGRVIGVEILNASEIFKPVIKPIQRQISHA
ncbi:MAG: DUF2283 domain-containing protein [Candidatus Doudnabacteria bacterium]|nr:DUF2283 domain-containing protein [Candidatus Doudnabacteria bacterium]